MELAGIATPDRDTEPQAPSYEDLCRDDLPKVYRLLRTSLDATHDEAMDAAAHAFMQLFIKWKSLRKPRPWVRRVAVRKLLGTDVREKRRRDAELQAFERTVLLKVAEPASAAVLLDDALREAIDLMRGLGYRQRMAVALDAAGLSAEEIAYVMNAKVATVRTNLSAGHQNLRERRAQREAETAAAEKEIS